jgi:hypothetical protein
LNLNFLGQCFCDQGHFWGFWVILTSLAPAPPRQCDFPPVLNRPAPADFVPPPKNRPLPPGVGNLPCQTCQWQVFLALPPKSQLQVFGRFSIFDKFRLFLANFFC